MQSRSLSRNIVFRLIYGAFDTRYRGNLSVYMQSLQVCNSNNETKK